MDQAAPEKQAVTSSHKQSRACAGLTGGELVLTEAAVGLLHLDPDPASELDVPVQLPGVQLVLENTHTGILTP